MPGRIAAVALTANTDTLVWTPGTTVLGSFTAIVCNQGTVPALVRLGVSAAGTVAWATDTVQPDTLIPPGGFIERAGLLAYGANGFHAKANQAGVNVMILGVE